MTGGIAPVELLISALVRLLEGCRTVAVGASSPIPAAAALLTEHLSRGRLTAMLLGSTQFGPFSDGGPELFDRAGQGRIDAFFLGGGQIDGEGNINLVGAGPYPRSNVRFPGSFGSPYLYFTVPNVILFREEHTSRVLVPRVDFISAPGWSAGDVRRAGGPVALVTGRAVFAFSSKLRRFRLTSMHPGSSIEDIRSNTGFTFDAELPVPETIAPPAEWLAALHGPVREKLATIYPAFVSERLRPG